MFVDKVLEFISYPKTLNFCINGAKVHVFLRQVVPRIMIRYNKQYIVVKSQYVSQILQYIAIPQFWIKKNFQRTIVNIFLPIIFSKCFGCSKEPSQ